MPFYMDHPQHGAHVFYTPEEVAENAKIGWVMRDPQPGEKKVERAPEVEVVKRKPGRPRKDAA